VFGIARSAKRDSTAIAAGTVGTTVLEPGARMHQSLHLHNGPPFESLALNCSPFSHSLEAEDGLSEPALCANQGTCHSSGLCFGALFV